MDVVSSFVGGLVCAIFGFGICMALMMVIGMRNMRNMR
jgi:uncharacterized membrane protein